MILPDHEIWSRIGRDLIIENMEDPNEQIQPCSVDCTLDDTVIQMESDKQVPVDVKNHKFDLREIEIDDVFGYPLKSGEFILASTNEWFSIPDDLVGHMEGRSSIGRLGVMVHVTAGLCDPGYEGQVTLELKNVSDETVILYPDMRISQMTFTKLTSPAEEPYGDERGSKYQRQEGATASRISEDFKDE